MPNEDSPQGTQTQTGQGEGDAPKYVTAEELNRAITARFSAFSKQIEKSLGDSIGGAISSKLEELKATLAPQGTDKTDAPKGANIEDHPILKGLQKQLADAQAATKRIEAERDAEKTRARDQVLRTKLTDELTRGGVDPKYVRQAVGFLVDVEKRVRFSDDDSEDIVYRDATGDVDLTTGVKSWAKTDEAKIYLPPRGTQGSGDRSQGRPQQGNSPQAPSAGRALLEMVEALPGMGVRSV